MKYKNHGFTLIELIASITILGIIGTIGIQSFLIIQKQQGEDEYKYYSQIIENGANLMFEGRKYTLSDGQCLSVKVDTLIAKDIIKANKNLTCTGSLILKKDKRKYVYDDSLLSCKEKNPKSGRAAKVYKNATTTSNTGCTELS